MAVPMTSSLPTSESYSVRSAVLSLMTLTAKVSFHTGFLPPSVCVLVRNVWPPTFRTA